MTIIRFAMVMSIAAIGASLPGVLMDDVRAEPRTRVDVSSAPWHSIGKLQAVAGSLRETCTAALIGPQTIATAAHCLFNIRSRRYFLPSSVHFLLGLEGSRFTSATIAQSFYIAPGYDPEAAGNAHGNDWALVSLTASLPSRQPLGVALAVPPIGSPVMVGGYGQDNPNVLTADTACHLTGLVRDPNGHPLLMHDCHAVRGVSGAPLLVRLGAQWTIAGLNVAQSRTGSRGFAAPVDAITRER